MKCSISKSTIQNKSRDCSYLRITFPKIFADDTGLETGDRLDIDFQDKLFILTLNPEGKFRLASAGRGLCINAKDKKLPHDFFIDGLIKCEMGAEGDALIIRLPKNIWVKKKTFARIPELGEVRIKSFAGIN